MMQQYQTAAEQACVTVMPEMITDAPVFAFVVQFVQLVWAPVIHPSEGR